MYNHWNNSVWPSLVPRPMRPVSPFGGRIKEGGLVSHSCTVELTCVASPNQCVQSLELFRGPLRKRGCNFRAGRKWYGIEIGLFFPAVQGVVHRRPVSPFGGRIKEGGLVSHSCTVELTCVAPPYQSVQSLNNSVRPLPVRMASAGRAVHYPRWA